MSMVTFFLLMMTRPLGGLSLTSTICCPPETRGTTRSEREAHGQSYTRQVSSNRVFGSVPFGSMPPLLTGILRSGSLSAT